MNQRRCVMMSLPFSTTDMFFPFIIFFYLRASNKNQPHSLIVSPITHFQSKKGFNYHSCGMCVPSVHRMMTFIIVAECITSVWKTNAMWKCVQKWKFIPDVSWVATFMRLLYALAHRTFRFWLYCRRIWNVPHHNEMEEKEKLYGRTEWLYSLAFGAIEIITCCTSYDGDGDGDDDDDGIRIVLLTLLKCCPHY